MRVREGDGVGGGAGTRVLTFMKQIFIVRDSGETAEYNPDGFLFSGGYSPVAKTKIKLLFMRLK